MGYYRTCPHCGAHLDPGEVCDCVAASTPLTTSDVEYATGVYRQKIYADLYAGLLIGTKPDGKHWSIQAMDCLEWARYLWDRGRTLMYPPDRAEKYLRDFKTGRFVV